MHFRSLVQENPEEEETATHSSILAWKIPWTEGPGVTKSWTQLRTHTCTQTLTHNTYYN